MFNDLISKSIIKSQHCQRNWDLSKEIPEDDMKLLESAVTNCPSKQNVVFYTPYFITDRKVIEEIYENTDGFTVSYETGESQKNSQVLANLLVAFVKNTDFMKEKYRNFDTKKAQESKKSELMNKEIYLNLGIASGYLNLTASMLGYSTGCCQCFNQSKVKEILGCNETPLLLMGVGFKDTTRSRREHHKEDFVFPTFKKNMEVKRI